MRNRSNPGAAPIGPKNNWGAWRARKDRAIQKPRKNGGAKRMAKTEQERAKE